MELFKLFGTIALNNSEAIKGIKDTTHVADDASSKIDDAFEKIGSAAVKVGKVMAVGLGAGVVAITALTKKALESYAEYEQLVGGVETLFGAGGKSLEEYAKSVGKTVDEVEAEYNNLMLAQESVMANASEAYKTAGMSANEYMETVTGFSASLIQSLDGDTAAAAEKANQAIVDMSDNANKMGSSMESIQNAYQGFAKQNYTMLDNLKLGYGGTQEEMQRLLADAQAISGIEYDISSYADVVDAIHVIQEEMGIAGTTAKEAAETISGSTASMKAAWSNLVTGLGNDNADLSKLIDEFVDSTVIAAKNILPRIEQILKGIADLVKKLVPQITSMLPGLIENVLPPLLEAAASLIQGLADAIPDLLDLLLEVLPEFIELGVEIVDSILEGILDNIGKMGSSATQIVVKLTTGILQLLPKFLEVGAKLIVSIIQGISQSLPQIIKTITDVALQLVNVLIQNLPLFIESGLQLIVSLTEGILEALPDLLAKMPEIIENLVEALLDSIDLIIDAGVQLLTALVENLDEIINAIVAVLPQIITAIVNALTSEDGLASVIQAGVTLLTALIDNIDDIIVTIVGAIPALITAIVGAFTSEEALSSMADAGVDIIYSLLEGLVSAWGSVTSWANSAVSWLSNKFQEAGIGGYSGGVIAGLGTIGNQVGSKSSGSGTRSMGSRSSAGDKKVTTSGTMKRVGQYADGGVVPKGQIAFLEGYGAEAVVPLEKTAWIDKVAQNMDSALGGKDTSQKLDRLIALQEQMLEIMPELANVSIQLNNREFGRAVRQVNA